MSGSSADPEIVAELEALAAESSRVMVILDSDHRSDHVAQELRLYAPLVTEGCYLIVEGTNLNGRPVMPEFGPGPAEALAGFLVQTDQFRVDRERGKLL